MLSEKDIFKYSLVAGIDEVGRGCFFGPVVAAAVILPRDMKDETILDSKKLSQKKRETANDLIREKALAIGIGIVENNIIDKINIKEATKLAMKKAVLNLKNNKGLKINPELLLIDAETIDIDIPQISIIKGDEKYKNISAASIVAKVFRDDMIINLDSKFPGYGLKNNKGYGTREHIDGIKKIGISNYHRKSFLKKYI